MSRADLDINRFFLGRTTGRMNETDSSRSDSDSESCSFPSNVRSVSSSCIEGIVTDGSVISTDFAERQLQGIEQEGPLRLCRSLEANTSC